MCVNRHALHCYCLHPTWEIYPITKKARKIFFIAFSLKYVRMSKCILTICRGLLWIQNENLDFSTAKMAAVLI